MTYLDAAPSKEVKTELIKTLMEICEAKIYVEAEGARLHLMLANILEEDGDLAGACDAIQDVHVETYGTLTKREKADYILQQVRLNLLRQDLIRTMIQSRKMNRKTLDEEGFEDVRERERERESRKMNRKTLDEEGFEDVRERKRERESRKMNRKTLDEEGFEDVKIAYYQLMVEYHMLERNVW
eukprot:CAMPEP_0182437664 /NCGR_PEP_ID=MMETSP1167-20130531/85198_1 /TAXON_ID=2988 /ORGANISM="Mallomonas Sp, Strain CCMP3275" /LENGTH=183 /DNA_ID=CAMNT_0024630659 /DNA_START=470 /DNA_END=1018 /DNA_ORIENTATION=+